MAVLQGKPFTQSFIRQGTYIFTYIYILYSTKINNLYKRCSLKETRHPKVVSGKNLLRQHHTVSATTHSLWLHASAAFASPACPPLHSGSLEIKNLFNHLSHAAFQLDTDLVTFPGAHIP